jgi:hypothetical protein
LVFLLWIPGMLRIKKKCPLFHHQSSLQALALNQYVQKWIKSKYGLLIYYLFHWHNIISLFTTLSTFINMCAFGVSMSVILIFVSMSFLIFTLDVQSVVCFATEPQI